VQRKRQNPISKSSSEAGSRAELQATEASTQFAWN